MDFASLVTPRFLADLTKYGRERITSGEGAELLESLHVVDPTLCEAYGIGYLPKGFRKALPGEYRDVLCHRRLRLGNSIILPATDEKGAIVDALMVRDGMIRSFLDPAQGMLGSRVVTAYPDLIVASTFGLLAHLWNGGHRNVLLLRRVEDAKNNARRLKATGVRSVLLQVRRKAEDVASILHGAGLTVQVAKTPKSLSQGSGPKLPEWSMAASLGPSTPPTPATSTEAPEKSERQDPPESPEGTVTFAGYDNASEMATFRYRDAEYRAEVALETESRMEITLHRGGKIHRDRFDLSVEAQRKRFCSSACMRTGLDADEIDGHLIKILDEVRNLKTSILDPSSPAPAPVEIGPRDREKAMALLQAFDLLDHIRKDLDTLGWVGEEQSKGLLYLAATSRKLATPIWAALRASPGAGKSHGMDLIAALTPPEELIQVSRLTDSALYYQNPEGLRHKLLVIDEADALTPEVVVALRVFKTRGALSLSHVRRNPVTGESRTDFMEVAGPLAVLTSTAGTLDDQLLSRCYELSVDESPEQTRRILATQRRLRASQELLGQGGKRMEIIKTHRTAQRLLECRDVLIPFAQNIEFPDTRVRHRREQERFLALIEASALLHQYQRLRHGDLIVAEERDYEIAKNLVENVHGRDSGLSRKAVTLLQALIEGKRQDFTMDDLNELMPTWSRHAFRSCLKEWIALEYVASLSEGRGRLRRYRIVSKSGIPGPGCPNLRQVGGLGEVGEEENTNLIQGAVAG